MISYPLFKRNMVSCVKPFIVILAVLCMYTLVIMYMYNPKLSDMLNDFQEALPGVMEATGMTGAATNLLEWMQIYLYGFLMMLFPLIFTVIIVHKLLMSYIDNGSMANILTTPNSRGKIIRTQALCIIIWMALLMAALTMVGIIGAQIMFPDELNVTRYIMLNASTLLIQLLVCGIAFLAACISTESKTYYTFGAGLPLIFFLLQMISNMGEKLENLKYVTIYTLLPAVKIVRGEGGVLSLNLIMAGLAILLFAIGIVWFERRDLSL